MLNNPSLTNILLFIVILLNIVTMILVMISMKNAKLRTGLVKEYQLGSTQIGSASESGLGQSRGYSESGVVFCRSCGAQYDSANSACPICKTAR